MTSPVIEKRGRGRPKKVGIPLDVSVNGQGLPGPEAPEKEKEPETTDLPEQEGNPEGIVEGADTSFTRVAALLRGLMGYKLPDTAACVCWHCRTFDSRVRAALGKVLSG